MGCCYMYTTIVGVPDLGDINNLIPIHGSRKTRVHAKQAKGIMRRHFMYIISVEIQARVPATLEVMRRQIIPTYNKIKNILLQSTNN